MTTHADGSPFTPPGEFSWPRAVARTLGLWALNYAFLALAVVLAGTGALVARHGAEVTAWYVLPAWIGLQGMAPLYFRSLSDDMDQRPQSPRFLRLHLLSHVVGAVLLAVLLRPLAVLSGVDAPPGSALAQVPDSPEAWDAVMAFAVAMQTWPVLSLLFTLRMTSRSSTMWAGLLLGVPAFLVSLLGGLTLGVFSLSAEHADGDALLALWGPLAGVGLLAYAVTLIWFRGSVRREPLGPPLRFGGRRDQV